MTNAPFSLLPLALLLSLLLPAQVLAQSDLARARKLYKECYKLVEQKKPCEAYKVCRDGLEAQKLQSLEELTDKARDLCKEEKRSKQKKCPDGMSRHEGTRNHCCWPGQIWAKPAGEDNFACVGTPTSCPEDHIPDRELGICRKTCDEDGRILTENGQCCWQGQAWSPVTQMCIGLPSCPEFYVMELTTRTGADGKEHVVEECFIADSDKDGINDFVDKCPTLSEDPDGHLDDDGCPEPDSDNDGVCDDTWQPSKLSPRDRLVASNCQGSDACPLIPEDFDGFQDADGCPDVDHDGDQICDAPSLAMLPEGWENIPNHRFTLTCTGVDQCLNEPETLNGHEDEDGCRDLSPEQVAAVRAVEDERATLNTIETAGWASLGTGLAVVAAGATLHFIANNRRDDVLAPDQTNGVIVTSIRQADIPGIADDANLLDSIGAGAMIGGGALTLTGVILILYGSLSEVSDDHLDPTLFSFSLTDERLFFSLQAPF